MRSVCWQPGQHRRLSSGGAPLPPAHRRAPLAGPSAPLKTCPRVPLHPCGQNRRAARWRPLGDPRLEPAKPAADAASIARVPICRRTTSALSPARRFLSMMLSPWAASGWKVITDALAIGALLVGVVPHAVNRAVLATARNRGKEVHRANRPDDHSRR
jgi:hypothetical protein